jgi:hypothetical protein
MEHRSHLFVQAAHTQHYSQRMQNVRVSAFVYLPGVRFGRKARCSVARRQFLEPLLSQRGHVLYLVKRYFDRAV